MKGLAGKRVLITGACGTVGSLLVERFLNNKTIVCAFDNDENGLFFLGEKYRRLSKYLRLFCGDVRDESRTKRACKEVDVIFHCAAMKHVIIGEYNPTEVVDTNVGGVTNIITAALECGVGRVLFTSSDKAVNPTSTMGISKLLGEKLMISANNYVGKSPTRFACVRFGNILDSRGSVVEIFNSQMKQNLPLSITSDQMTRFVLTKDEAINLCLSALKSMRGGETFIQIMKSLLIKDLGLAIVGDDRKVRWSKIGCKPGEKLYEELATSLEAERTYFDGGLNIILPEIEECLPLDSLENISRIKGCPRVHGELRSDKVKLLSINEIKLLL